MLITYCQAISHIDFPKFHDRIHSPLSICHLKHLLIHNQASILPGEALGLRLSFKIFHNLKVVLGHFKYLVFVLISHLHQHEVKRLPSIFGWYHREASLIFIISF